MFVPTVRDSRGLRRAGGAIHLTHAALADEGGDFVRADATAGRENHELSGNVRIIYNAVVATAWSG
jgi:hypothetical protein